MFCIFFFVCRYNYTDKNCIAKDDILSIVVLYFILMLHVTAIFGRKGEISLDLHKYPDNPVCFYYIILRSQRK